MSDKAPKPPWAEEPSPLCDNLTGGLDDPLVDADLARNLERRLRCADRLLRDAHAARNLTGLAAVRVRDYLAAVRKESKT